MNGSRLSGRTIFVAGAAGFIGARIAAAAVSEGATVRALVRSGRTARLEGLSNIEIVRCALKDRAGLIHAASGADAIVNAAYDFLADEASLLAEFDNLIAAAQETGAKGLVQLSSIAVYDDWPCGDLTEASPKDRSGGFYKNVKRDMERRLERSRVPHTILQPTIVYGAGGWQWTDRAIEQLKTGVVILPDGEPGLCHAVYVDDVAAAAVAALAMSQQPNAHFIVSGPQPITWRDYFAGYASLIGAPPPRLEPMTAPAKDLSAAAAPSPVRAQAIRLAKAAIGEGGLAALRGAVAKMKNGGRPVEHRPSGPMMELYAARARVATERARATLGWTPAISFEEGLKRIKKDYRL
jgi:nucleoside-diphosphate-sugar epimerase